MRLIIFDVDGTLVDSAAIILRSQYDTFARHGLVHPGREAGLGVVGLTLDIALAQLAGLDAPDDALSETYKSVFNNFRTHLADYPDLAEPLYPGVEAALARLAADPRSVLAIATGKSRRGADYLLDRHNWRALFKSVQTADDAPSKPDPGMILRAMAETGASPEQTVMIGDSTFDMMMAVSADVVPLGVTWGFQPSERLVEAGAQHLVTHYDDLVPLLDQIVPLG